MVLRFFLFTAMFLFASCSEMKFNNPDDPDSPNYIGKSSSSSDKVPLSSARQSSSSNESFSSSSIAVPSSNSTPSSSSSVVATLSSSSSKQSSSSNAPSSSSSVAVPSSSSAVVSSSSVTVSSSSSSVPSSSSAPSSSSVAVSSSSLTPSSCSSVPPSSSSVVPSSSSVQIKAGPSVTHGSETYQTVVIGTQTWMARNLNYNAYGSKCYDNNEANCTIYGRLYTWEAANNVCPSGWHLPSNTEWNVLMKFVNTSCSDNSNCAGAGKSLKAKSGWNDNGNGDDTYGFSALPGGLGFSVGSFYDVGNYGFWWSASEYDSDYAYRRYMNSGDELFYNYFDKYFMFSVRCLKD